jgi:uncharacterized protein (DUF427 family)
MSLTVGTGPFSKRPAGRFNVAIDSPGATLFWDPVEYRVRGFLGGEAIVDSRRVMMLHETGHLPVWYFPEDDLRADLLEPSEKTTHCPFKGDATYRSIRVGDRVARDVIWAYRDPIESARFLAGYAAFFWRELDEWFVEDEQVQGHPRDPYSRIDVYKTTRHVRVLIDREAVADTRRAHVLFETGLPPRYYIPVDDVRSDLLVDSATTTRCAYKGVASYWHVQLGDRTHGDIVWTYTDPEREAEAVRDLLCFFNERVDLELDGEVFERPRTQWSRD